MWCRGDAADDPSDGADDVVQMSQGGLPDQEEDDEEEPRPDELTFCELCGSSEKDDDELLRCEECGRLHCSGCREYDEDGTPHCTDCSDDLAQPS